MRPGEAMALLPSLAQVLCCTIVALTAHSHVTELHVRDGCESSSL